MIDSLISLCKFLYKLVTGEIDLIQLLKSASKAALTIITANILFRSWYYQNYQIIDFNIESISKYIFSTEIFKPIICCAISYFFFYGFLFSILRYLFAGWMEKKVSKTLNKWKDELTANDVRQFHSIIIRLIRKVFRSLHQYGIIQKNAYSTRFDNDTTNEMISEGFNTVCFIIHALFVYGYFSHFFTIGMIFLYIICLLIIPIMSIGYIALKFLSPIVNRVFEHEEKVN